MDCAQVGVLHQANEIGFRRLLEAHDGLQLESDFGFEVLGDFLHQSEMKCEVKVCQIANQKRKRGIFF